MFFTKTNWWKLGCVLCEREDFPISLETLTWQRGGGSVDCHNSIPFYPTKYPGPWGAILPIPLSCLSALGCSAVRPSKRPLLGKGMWIYSSSSDSPFTNDQWSANLLQRGTLSLVTSELSPTLYSRVQERSLITLHQKQQCWVPTVQTM